MRGGPIGPIAILLLVACGPSEQHKAELAEQKRLECLDKLCEGDVPPKRDPIQEEALKFNGQWFIGPKDYFSTGINGAAFFWPSKTPARSNVPDFPEKAQVTSGHADEVTIAIFLRSHDGVMHGPTRYEALRKAELEGRLVSKTSPRPGLEVWRVRDEVEGTAIWHVATNLKDANDEPPVLFCRGGRNPQSDKCTGAFIWMPGISVDFRFHNKHGPDWPEIHQEIVRVLQLLKKAST